MLRSALVLGIVTWLTLASPAAACPVPETAQAFSAVGDDARYAAVGGGAFEGALTWSATGSPELVSAPDRLANGSTTAVSLRTGDSIVSPGICIDRGYDYVRFLLRAEDRDSRLGLSVSWTGGDGKLRQVPLGDYDARRYGTWGLSRVARLKSALPRDADARDIRLRFTVDGDSAAWRIDDVRIAYSPPRPCPSAATTRAFAPWGDHSEYAPVAGGTFEDAIGWASVGAPEIAPGDHPFDVAGASTAAARLRSGDSITSPSLCIDRSYPHLRFVLRAVDATSRLRLTVLWTDGHGDAKQVVLGHHYARWNQAWGLSRIVWLRQALPQGEVARDVRLRFSVEGRDGEWLVDNVLVDPYKRT